MPSPRIFPPLSLLRASLLTATLVASLARAQSPDEKTTFPPNTTPASAAPRAVKSAQPASDKQAADQPSEPAPLASTQERFVPSGEQRTPSTLSNGWTDPKNLRHTSSAEGGAGLLRVAGADLGPRGLLRFSLTGEHFKSSDFPVQGAENTRTAGIFALSYVPLDFLQVYAAYSAASNTNSRSSPNLIQALGDVTLGARGSRQWAQGLWAGVDLRALFFAGTGDHGSAFSFSPRVIATYDLRQLRADLPLRAHGDLGLVLGGTDSLASDSHLNAAEEYALGINRYSRLGLGLGVEAPLRAVTPFLEFNMAYPLGVGGDGLVAPDGQTVSAASAALKTLNLGVKVTAVRDVTFSLGAELGLTRAVGLGVPATPPLNLVFGVSYAVDLLAQGGTRVIETVREPPAQEHTPPVAPQTAQRPQLAQVAGVVLDAQTHKPLAGVLVTMPGAGLPPVATEAETGRFLTQSLAAGPVRIAAQKEGYRIAERDLKLEPGQTSTVELSLEPEAHPAVFTVSTTSQKKAVAATVSFQGPKSQELSTSESTSTPAKMELPAGHYVVNVIAPGYLAQTREVQASSGATQELSFDLEPEPKKKLVELKDKRIELSQQVHFANGKAVILPDSGPLLAQVVDVIVRNGLKKVRIEGHTDNQGDPAVNQKLSEDRAKAVAASLTQAGINASRLEAVGFGETRPIAPNLTPRGRELNRRVEFVIVER